MPEWRRGAAAFALAAVCAVASPAWSQEVPAAPGISGSGANADLAEEVRRLTRERDAAQAQLRELRAELTRRTQTLGTLESRLADREAVLETLRRRMADQGEGLGAFRERLAQQETVIAGLRAEVAQRTASLSAANQRLAERDAAVSSTAATLAAKDKALSELKAREVVLRGMADGLKSELTRRETRNAELVEVVAARDGTVIRLNKELESQRQRTAELEAALAMVRTETERMHTAGVEHASERGTLEMQRLVLGVLLAGALTLLGVLWFRRRSV